MEIALRKELTRLVCFSWSTQFPGTRRQTNKQFGKKIEIESPTTARRQHHSINGNDWRVEKKKLSKIKNIWAHEWNDFPWFFFCALTDIFIWHVMKEVEGCFFFLLQYYISRIDEALCEQRNAVIFVKQFKRRIMTIVLDLPMAWKW